MDSAAGALGLACAALEISASYAERRTLSEAKKFATETAWGIVNLAMQVMGGAGDTNMYSIERLLRDARLVTIWTGTDEIMNLVF